MSLGAFDDVIADLGYAEETGIESSTNIMSGMKR